MTLLLSLFGLPVFSLSDPTSSGWLWPVPSSAKMSRGFYRVGEAALYPSSEHTAIDIKPPDSFRLTTGSDTPVVASKAGEVVMVYSGCAARSTPYSSGHTACSPLILQKNGEPVFGQKWGGCCNWGLGNAVVLFHGNGLYSVYAHLVSVTVSVGQTVGMGQTVGFMGSSGSATGKHLDFSIHFLPGTPDSTYIKGECLNVNPIGGGYAITDYPAETNGIGGIVYLSEQSGEEESLLSPAAVSAYFLLNADTDLHLSPSVSSPVTATLAANTLLPIGLCGKNGKGETWGTVGAQPFAHEEYAGFFLPFSSLSPLRKGNYVVDPDLGANLSFRLLPALSSTRLDLIPPGTRLSVTDFSGGFGQTEWKGQSGWVALGYLIAEEEEAPPPVPEVTVFFDAAGGTVSEQTRKVLPGSVYGTLPFPQRGDDVFGGWFLKGIHIGPDTVVSETYDHILSARWFSCFDLDFDGKLDLFDAIRLASGVLIGAYSVSELTEALSRIAS